MKRLPFFAAIISILCLTPAQAQLPEGAKARFGLGRVFDIAYSPDGTRLAVAGEAGIGLYDVRTSVAIHLLTGTGHTGRVYSVSFSPDGSILASGSDDKTVLLWDISPAPTPYPGDFDGDLNVDFADFLAFVGVFGLSSSDANYDARMDMNGDGIINFSDFLIFTIIFGTKYS